MTGQKRKAAHAAPQAGPSHQVTEWISGELYVSPRPAVPYAVAASELLGELSGPFGRGRGGPGGWRLWFAPELHLGEDVLVPDVAGWRRERMPRTPRTAALTPVPDWVCEVLSPSTRTLDQTAKLPVYAREGVRHVWWVDPDARTLEVLRLEGSHYRLLATHTGPARLRAEPFESLEWAPSLLWEE